MKKLKCFFFYKKVTDFQLSIIQKQWKTNISCYNRYKINCKRNLSPLSCETRSNKDEWKWYKF